MTAGTFGRYQLLSQLGRGAMGTVYRALDPALERTVAIKTLNPDIPDEDMAEIKARFLREAKSAGQLNHPNVVTVYEVGEADGIAYIAMECLEGQSLRQLLDSGSLLPLYTISDVIAQIADALDYAQRFGIVHRDIKPANIMLSPMGVAKLTDFGVAYIPSSSMTQLGQVLGSPKYLSPEQVLGQPVDGRSDIFSLGVVLYEMLTRKAPFERGDGTQFTLMERIVSEPAPPVSRANHDIPAAFDLIIARALAKRPEERYQRAADFASDLRNYRRLAPDSTSADMTTFATRAVSLPAATPAAAANASTMPAQSTGNDADAQENMAKLLADIDSFSRNFDEENAHRKIALEAQKRAEAEARANAAAAKSGSQSPKSAQSMSATTTKRALVDMLREQAQAKAQQRQRSTETSLESLRTLNAKMRQAYDYFLEFVRGLNEATPVFAGKLNLIYLGSLPAPTLSAGNADCRTKQSEVQDVIDYITLRYRMISAERARITLNSADARLLKAQLERATLTCEEREEKSEPGKAPRLALSIACDIHASATLRADYAAHTVQIVCRNVGVLGPAKYGLAAADFNDDNIEEFGKLLLGYPNRFAGFRRTDDTV